MLFTLIVGFTYQQLRMLYAFISYYLALTKVLATSVFNNIRHSPFS